MCQDYSIIESVPKALTTILRIQILIYTERTIKILQQLMLHILFAQECIFSRYLPINAKGIILDADATISLRSIEVIAFILKDSCLGEYSKSMCETSWHEELTMVILCQLNSHMLTVCW